MKKLTKELEEEAAAFDNRIIKRSDHGFVPDLRNAVSCNYFYKSFWREPKYIDLYLGNILKTIITLFNKYSTKNIKILDVGCGHGLMSLELARLGYKVKGIDISSKNIDLANQTLLKNTEPIGSLEYEVSSFENFITETPYDVIFFCGSLHHMQNLSYTVQKASKLLKENGLLYCHEPIHSKFTVADSAQVALIRTLLSQTGFWYNPDETAFDKTSEEEFIKYSTKLKEEYVFERDVHEEGGQSPNDLEADGEEILEELKKEFSSLEYIPSASFIYRVLGGLRGTSEKIFEIADFLATYDRAMTQNGSLNPNYFHYIGRKYSKKED